MEKQEILNEVSRMAASGEIAKNELLDAYAAGRSDREPMNRIVSFSDVLYFIGGGIVFLGLVILVGQNWDALNSVSRVLITLGSAIITYAIGALLFQNQKYSVVSAAFFMISGLMFPLGMYVLMDALKIDWSGFGVQALVSAILLVLFLLSGFIFKKNIFLFFSIVFGTWLFHSGVLALFGTLPDLYTYVVLITGCAYILLGYYFSDKVESALTGPLYGFGSLALLGAAIFLTGAGNTKNMFWEVLFPFIDFFIIYLSVSLRSRVFLVFGALFLMADIMKVTGEYFLASFGWPFALVLSGLLLMGIGYGAYFVNRRYIKPLV